jgi:coenzyme F420-reducing hydrogenase alpha subunit
MCPEVLFHGEYVDPNWLNRWLQNPENQRKIDELEAQEKAEEQEQKKHLQKQKRAASQLREKKAAEYFHKYRQELGGPDVVLSEESARILWRRAYNAVEYDYEHQEWLKRQEEERKRDEQEEKQRKERQEQDRKQRQEYLEKLPEQQLQMILTGTRGKWADGCRQYAEFGHNRYCPNTAGEDLEPGLRLLKQEYSIGKLVRYDEQTHNRLVKFGKPDETPLELINRLLDIAASANKKKTI